MGVGRRAVLGGGVAALVSACGSRPSPAGAPSTTPSATAAAPARTGAAETPEQVVFTPGRTVVPLQTPAGYAKPLNTVITRYLAPNPDHPKYPAYAGAVLLVAVDGQVTVHEAVGDALRYGTGPAELPKAQRVAMRSDAIFDLASITKVFTALLVLQLVDQGKVRLDAPVADYLPHFGKQQVTVGMVLAHTGALPGSVSFAGAKDNTERWNRVLTAPLVAQSKPGTTFRYSGVGIMVLGLLVEKLTGLSLDAAVQERIAKPLGLRDTMFTPLKRLQKDDPRLVATEARKARGLTRGVVHDDLCLALGGVAGHAGMFGTAADLAVVGQMLVNGGEYNQQRILSERTVRTMITNVNQGLPAIDAERPTRSADHGLGVELKQPWFMGRLARPVTFGHTGFTGTSLVVDPDRRLVVVLLTNRAHPDWTRANPDKPRVAVADVLADALQ
ncbi:serine hydrolase domain-containing protein [Dactylosporangium sp. AC04546]|uniref:serine hydrolase domain-containing protein n=1 Tax=Dactylosporangium sp. AC04546 TaxID=2862460 RepID=UPI001EDFD2BF|nr:serine hydrolase domain-containing protein [Dactylosporangium sp. AC04546]WVK87621.1 serine hydrolase domain-containing protein [Dactylosporangium sp. AC04546]